jgi:hypothetical protein
MLEMPQSARAGAQVPARCLPNLFSRTLGIPYKRFKPGTAFDAIVIGSGMGRGAEMARSGADQPGRDWRQRLLREEGRQPSDAFADRLPVAADCHASATGVRMKDGSTIPTRVVISDVGIHATLGSLLRESGSTKVGRATARLEPLQPSTGHVCLYAGLTSRPEL